MKNLLKIPILVLTNYSLDSSGGCAIIRGMRQDYNTLLAIKVKPLKPNLGYFLIKYKENPSFQLVRIELSKSSPFKLHKLFGFKSPTTIGLFLCYSNFNFYSFKYVYLGFRIIEKRTLLLRRHGPSGEAIEKLWNPCSFAEFCILLTKNQLIIWSLSFYFASARSYQKD